MDVMYKNANDKAEIYIRPYRNVCDVILSGVGTRPLYKQLMERFLDKVNNQ